LKAEAIIEAAMRGLVSALLDVQAPVPPGKPPSKRTPRRARLSPSGAPSVTHADLPLPGFDPAADDLPLVPPATLRDMEAEMAVCPLVQGGGWHLGFGEIYLSLGTPGGGYDFIAGHSLGCPLAQFLALSHGAKALYLFAPPKPGNEALAAAVRAAVPYRESYAMRYDWIPRLPFYVPIIAPFVPVDDPTELDPASVSPAIGPDPESQHALASYSRVLSALP
jgi:hypothetical protein